MPTNTFRIALMGAGLALGVWCLPARAADDSDKKPADSPPSKTDSPNTAHGSDLEQFKAKVESLKLTDEQRAKVDHFFDSAEQELKALSQQPDSAERKQKVHAVSTRLRSEILAVLTDDQKAEFVKKKATPSPDTTGATIDRIKKDLDKPGSKLTAEQKRQVDAVLDDTKKKIEDLHTQARESNTDVSAKVQAVLQEMKQKLAAILASGK